MIQTSKASEFRKEGEDQLFKNARTLQKMDQTLEVLMGKMTDFELKLNYVLLRRTKVKKQIKMELQGEAKNRISSRFTNKLQETAT